MEQDDGIPKKSRGEKNTLMNPYYRARNHIYTAVHARNIRQGKTLEKQNSSIERERRKSEIQMDRESKDCRRLLARLTLERRASSASSSRTDLNRTPDHGRAKTPDKSPRTETDEKKTEEDTEKKTAEDAEKKNEEKEEDDEIHTDEEEEHDDEKENEELEETKVINPYPTINLAAFKAFGNWNRKTVQKTKRKTIHERLSQLDRPEVKTSKTSFLPDINSHLPYQQQVTVTKNSNPLGYQGLNAPEAIDSIRRRQKTIDEQLDEVLKYKLASNSKPIRRPSTARANASLPPYLRQNSQAKLLQARPYTERVSFLYGTGMKNTKINVPPLLRKQSVPFW